MIELTHQKKIFIIPTYPFHFDSTFYKPAHFPSSDTRWEPGKRWQTMLWQGKRLGLIFQDAGTKQKPKVLVRVFSRQKLTPKFLDTLKKEIIWRYNLGLDLSGFYGEVKQDKILKPIIKKFRGLRPMHHGSLYEYLIIAIVLQNATVKRSVNMMQALFENYGACLKFDKQKFWCFWGPKTLARASEKRLRDLKMGYRDKFLIEVSKPFAKKKLDELVLRTSGPLEQEQTLVSLYGIGPASIGYIMFDVFHHWDHLKHISPWEQKIYTKIFFNRDYKKKLVPAEKMIKYFDQKWGKWKGLAVHYVWEDIWWKRRNEHISWLEELVRL